MSCDHCQGRRKFLERSAQGALALVAMPGLQLLTGCSNGDSGKAAAAAPGVTGSFTFDFATYPALQNNGGSVYKTVQTSTGDSVGVSVVRTGASTASAVNVTCTHMSCAIQAYNGTDYDCNCHGSKFSVGGTVLQGPATKNLPSYAATVTASAIEVTFG